MTLSQRVKAKYPQYAQMDDADLEKRVLAKYPQYGSIASQPSQPQKKTVGGFLGNVVKSTGRAIGDTVSGVANVFNPNPEKNTLNNLRKLGVGAYQKLTPGVQENEKYADAVGQFYKDRYGGFDKIKDTLYNDPAGVALDVATVAGGSGLAIKGVNLGAKSARLGKVANTLTKIDRALDPIQATGRVFGKIGSVFKKPLAKVGSKINSESLLTKGLGNPAKQAKITRRGITPGGLMKKYNLFDRDPETAQAALNKIFKEYDNRALNPNSKIDLQKIIQGIDTQIEKYSSGASKFSEANQKTLAELVERKNQLLEMFPDQKVVSGEELTKFRRTAIDPDIPDGNYFTDTAIKGKAKGTKKVRDIIKDSINATDDELKQLGIDAGGVKELVKVFEGYQNRVANRQLFNFTKLGSAGVGGFLGGVPGAVGGFMLEMVANNPAFLRYAAGVLDKLESLAKAKKIPITSDRAALVEKIVQEGSESGIQTQSKMAQKVLESIENGSQPKTLNNQLSSRLQSYYDIDRNLPSEFAQIQEKFFKELSENPKKYIIEYQKKFKNVLNPDDARSLSYEYRQNPSLLAGAVHEPSSAFTKLMYDYLLENNKTNTKPVTFTAGGAGSGKTTAIDGIREIYKIKKKSSIVYDSTLSNSKKAVKLIDKALKNNPKSKIALMYVMTDPVSAFERAIVRASKPKGRTVPIKHFVQSHVGSKSSFPEIAQYYKNNSRVKTYVIDNTGDIGTQKIVPLENIYSKVYTTDELERILYEIIEKQYRSGTIKDEVYRGFKGDISPTSPRLERHRGGMVQVAGDIRRHSKQHGAKPQERWSGINNPNLPNIARGIYYTGRTDRLFNRYNR